MRHLILLGSILALTGCIDQQPLAPAFAGMWVPPRNGDCAKGFAISLSRSWIGVHFEKPRGMTVPMLSIEEADVKGDTAHLRLRADEVSQKTGLAGLAELGELADHDVLLTLTVSRDRLMPSNIRLRNQKTGQFLPRSRKAGFIDEVLTLKRCHA